MAEKDIQDGVYVARNKPKELPKLYEEELSPLDLKWNGKGWSSDATSVKTPKKDSIPEIYPTQDGTSQRLSIDRGKQGIPEKMADVNLMEADGGSPMDYMDAPASGVAKAFAFVGLPDKDALQLAMSRLAMNGDKRADAIMKLSPKARDELTTAMYRQIETSPRDVNTRKAEGVGYIWPNRATGDVMEVNIGNAGSGFYRNASPFHEWYHVYDFLAGKLNDMRKKGTDYAHRISRSAKDDGAEIRELLDRIPAVQHAQQHFANYKKKDLDGNELVEFLTKDIMKSDANNELTFDEIKNIAIDLSDAITLRDKRFGGLWQTDAGVGIGFNRHTGQHKAGYNKEFRELGDNAEAMEGGANLNEIGSQTRWLETQGVKNEELYPEHLPYTAEEEKALAEDLRKSQYYEPDYKITTYKMRPTGSHADKFFEKEVKYMAENGGDHSPDWYSAIKEGWMGDRYGKFDEDALNSALDNWSKKNNVNLQHNDTFNLQTLLNAWDKSSTSKDEKNSILSSLIDDYVDYNQDGRWFVNSLNAGDLYSFSILPKENRWDILNLVGNGHDVGFTGTEWVDLSNMAKPIQFRKQNIETISQGTADKLEDYPSSSSLIKSIFDEK